MKLRNWILPIVMCCTIFVSVSGAEEKEEPIPVVTATRAESVITVNGMMNESAWRSAEPVELGPDGNWEYEAEQKGESVTVKLLYDDENLYVLFRVFDRDICGSTTLEQIDPFDPMKGGDLGDRVSIFLRPADDTFYYSLWVNFANRTGTFLSPAGGLEQFRSSFTGRKFDFQSATKVYGTANDSIKTPDDERYIVEIAIPWQELGKFAKSPKDGGKWLVAFSNIHYSRQLPSIMTLTFPKFNSKVFPLREEYATLELK